MSNPLEALKSFVGLSQPVSPPTASISTIEPTSHPVEGNKQKTELQASAPAIIPARLARSEIAPADDEIAISADAEAGVSLNEVMPVRRVFQGEGREEME